MSRFSCLILFFYLALLSFVFGIHPVGDFDIWWHIASGNWMYEHGAIPHHDPFSYTKPGAPWVHHEWGFSAMASAIWNLGGVNALILFKVFFLFLILYFSCRCLQVLKQTSDIPYLSLLLIAFLFFPRIQERPHMFSNLFYVFLFYTFHRYAGGLWLERKRLYIIPLLFMIWTNIHWGALVGWGLMVLFWLSQVGFSFQKGDKNYHGVLLKVCLLSGASLLVNPNTYHVFTFPFEHLGMKYIIRGTQEWLSPFGKSYRQYYIYQTYTIFLILSLGLAFFKWRRTHPDRLLLLLPLAYLSSQYNRYVDMFFLYVVPLLAVEWVSWPIWKDRFSFLKKYSASLGALISVVFLTILLYTGLPLGYGIKTRFIMAWGIIYPYSNFFPPVDFLKENNVSERVFSYFEYGGYLMLRGYPVYIDGRTPIYGDDFFKTDYIDPLTNSAKFEEIWKKWDFGVVFIDRRAYLAPYVAHHQFWRLVYADDFCFIFLDATKASNKPVIDKYAFPPEKVDPFFQQEGELTFTMD